MARVLVVDDESNIRLMVRLALQAAQHEVETASDGIEALEKFGQGASWDVVLLDQRMPGMEGLDVLREIRRRDAQSRVVMISAFGTIDLATSAMQSGAHDFLRKPFTTDVLRDTVQSVLLAETSCAPAHASAASKVTFSRNTSINGFRITSSTRNEENTRTNGAIHCYFNVHHSQSDTPCEVLLPCYVVEAVRAHADREKMPDEQHFLLWLSKEALANYLWQNAEMPPNGLLQVDELSTGLRRWVDAVLSQ